LCQFAGSLHDNPNLAVEGRRAAGLVEFVDAGATGLVTTGHAHAEILKMYPYLEAEDINQALKYCAWRAEELELPLQPA